MEEPKILYSKFYSEEKDEDFDILNDKEKIEEFNANMEEFKKRKYILKPIPERVKLSESYIKSCIEFSERHNVTLRIFEYPNRLHVHFCFDDPVSVKWLMPVFALSDEVLILTKDHLYGRMGAIILDFNTHGKIFSAD